MVADRTDLRRLQALLYMAAVQAHPGALHIRYKKLPALQQVCQVAEAVAVPLLNGRYLQKDAAILGKPSAFAVSPKER